MIPNNLTRKQLQRKNDEELLKILEDCPYPTRAEAIGNNDTIKRIFEILHYERKSKEIDCETAYCFESCNN